MANILRLEAIFNRCCGPRASLLSNRFVRKMRKRRALAEVVWGRDGQVRLSRPVVKI